MMDRKQIKKTPERAAFVSALVVGFFTHLFGLIVVQFNYDNIGSMVRGYGDGADFGRWLLQLLYELMDWLGFAYNLPVVNGLVFLAAVALASGLLVSALGVRSHRLAMLMGMLMAVFPTVTSTLFFRYCAPPYGLGILLAVFAAWVLPKGKLGFLASVLCMTLSLGIYQAYIPFTISILVLVLLREALEGKADVWPLIRKGLLDCGAILLAVAAYMVCSKAFLRVYHLELTHYQGIDEMGKLSLAELPGLLRRAYSGVLRLNVRDYCGVAPIPAIRLIYLLLGLVSAVMTVAILIRKAAKPQMVALVAGLCLVYPLAVNFITVMSVELVYTLMIYSFVMLPCTPLVLYEVLSETGVSWKKPLGKGLGIVTALLIFAYGYYDNVNYMANYYASVQVENYANALVAQVRMTEGFDTSKKWAFIGQIQDPMLEFAWDCGISYGGLVEPAELLGDYPRDHFFTKLLGYRFEKPSDEEIRKLAADENVKAMPLWPDQGSIQVIGDTVVIKCQELAPGE